jgi:hypothetical protein
LAAAPPLRYKISDMTVEDKRSHLVWQRGFSPELMGLSGAKDYCAKLTIAGGGFRLPTVQELLSLFDPTTDPDVANPKTEGTLPARIDPTAFPGTPRAEFFWSSTPVVVPNDCAECGSQWIVDYHRGPNRRRESDMGRVRCVR